MPKAIFGFSKWFLLLLTLFLGRTAVAAEAPSMDAEAYNHRGIAYYKQGQYDQAIADYTKALQIKPSDAEVYNNRGVVYGVTGQYDQAISDFTKALEINPKYAEAYNNRAYAYYYMKDYGRAWADLHEAQQLGAKIDTGFLKILREASGREE